MHKIGFIGWRGMVGQTFLELLTTHKIPTPFAMHFFSTSSPGKQVTVLDEHHTLLDANDLNALSKMDVLVVMQGSDYTQTTYPKLQQHAWPGFWLDAASHLRLDEHTALLLDPINHKNLEQALIEGKKTFVGPNCTVSLMLLAIAGILDDIAWVQASTYQAISGAGAKALNALVEAQQSFSGDYHTLSPQTLAYNLHPWIDTTSQIEGVSKEEYKGMVETQKIVKHPFPVASTCVRVPVLRCHSQDLTIQLKQPQAIDDIQSKLLNAHPWIKWVANDPKNTQDKLNPNAISGTTTIAVGRLRQSELQDNMIHLFTVGDQLLWGAALPLYRMLYRLLCGQFPTD